MRYREDDFLELGLPGLRIGKILSDEVMAEIGLLFALIIE
jgi:hypothetical protein